MIIWALIAIAASKQVQSFLQQDEEGGGEFWQEAQADYDRQRYNKYLSEEDKYRMEDYEPEGKSTPENDYLLVQYEVYIDNLYDEYYVEAVGSDTESSGQGEGDDEASRGS